MLLLYGMVGKVVLLCGQLEGLSKFDFKTAAFDWLPLHHSWKIL
jgi:hypothetical protein